MCLDLLVVHPLCLNPSSSVEVDFDFKKIKKGQILLIFPVLGKMTHMKEVSLESYNILKFMGGDS